MGRLQIRKYLSRKLEALESGSTREVRLTSLGSRAQTVLEISSVNHGAVLTDVTVTRTIHNLAAKTDLI